VLQHSFRIHLHDGHRDRVRIRVRAMAIIRRL
jgi:hypothetical protein